VRLRVGVAMPEKGGRTALVGAEVLEWREPDGRLAHSFLVGFVERVSPPTIEAASGRVVAIAVAMREHRPCFIVDANTAQGDALRRSLRDRLGRDLHRPHGHAGRRRDLFSGFLTAYTQGRVEVARAARARPDLERALVFYGGGGTKRDGLELESEDEALVVASGWRWRGPPTAGTRGAPAIPGTRRARLHLPTLRARRRPS
jgi:hypothetical protein